MREGYPAHQFADIFPIHEGKTLWELRDDIKEHGQREPIILYKKQVLDGRRRQACCLTLEIEPQYTEFKGSEKQALDLVISKNLIRRHLGEAERAMVAAKIAKMPHGGDRSKPPDGGLKTVAEAAEALNVSTRSVERAKVVAEDPEIEEAVRNGEMSLTAAADKVIETRPMPTKASRKRGPKKPKSGQEKFKYSEQFEKPLGQCMRAIDALARSYECKGSAESERLLKAIKAFGTEFKAWYGSLVKAKK